MPRRRRNRARRGRSSPRTGSGSRGEPPRQQNSGGSTRTSNDTTSHSSSIVASSRRSNNVVGENRERQNSGARKRRRRDGSNVREETQGGRAASGGGIAAQEKRSTAERPECAVCYETPRADQKYGLLGSCDHALCLKCIRSWRRVNNNIEDDLEGLQRQSLRRSCPVCRKHSNFVTPSLRFAVGDEKLAISEGYKEYLSTLPCMYYKRDRRCPFTYHCFYRHERRDGTLVPIEEERQREEERQARRRTNEEREWPTLLNAERIAGLRAAREGRHGVGEDNSESDLMLLLDLMNQFGREELIRTLQGDTDYNDHRDGGDEDEGQGEGDDYGTVPALIDESDEEVAPQFIF